MLMKSLLHSELLCQRIVTRCISNKPSWDIVTSVCVERLPIVTPPLNELQKKYKEMLYNIEIEKSLKSDHELRHENDKVQAELLKNESVDVDMDAVSKITAQDFEDASTEEFAKFKFAAIETEADKKGNKSSPDRCLERHLVLLTKFKLGQEIKNLLPQGPRKEGETLRQTAERILKEHCGTDLNVQFLSNAPCGFYKYKYPTEIDGKVGAKVFFYYANYKSGNVSKSEANWLTRKEMKDILPEKYRKSVQDFLIDEAY